MKTNTQIRSQILRRIQRIPNDKLKELDEFVSKLETSTNKKDKIMSYAGTWNSIDNELFEEFTDSLLARRQSSKRRLDE